MYATRIKMRQGCKNSSTPLEIAEIYLEGCTEPGFYTKEILHDYLKKNPKSIKVKLSPFPFLIPAESLSREKYVRSEPNNTIMDNLLRLPKY